MTTLFGALFLMLASGCRPVPASSAPALSAAPSILDEGDSYLLRFSEDPSDACALLDLVKLCQEATGVNFTCDERTADELKASRVVLLGPKRVPKRDLLAFVELQLFVGDFTCTEMGPPPIAVVRIQSQQRDPRSQAQQRIAREPLPDLTRELADLDHPRDRSAGSRSAAAARSALDNPVLPPR